MGFGQQLDLGKKIVAHLGPWFLVRLLFAPAANGGIRMFPPAGSQFFPLRSSKTFASAEVVAM
jgi:hypothetical protein